MPKRIGTYRPPTAERGRKRQAAAVAAAYRRRPERVEASRFYARKRWIDLRDATLAGEPLCRRCAALGRTTGATVVDHIEPRTKRPDLAFEPSNLRPLCGPCHNAVRPDQGI